MAKRCKHSLSIYVSTNWSRWGSGTLCKHGGFFTCTDRCLDHPIYSFIGCLTQLICYFVLIIPFQYLAFKTHVRSQIDTREGEAGVIGKDIDDPGTTQGCCRNTSGRMLWRWTGLRWEILLGVSHSLYNLNREIKNVFILWERKVISMGQTDLLGKAGVTEGTCSWRMFSAWTSSLKLLSSQSGDDDDDDADDDDDDSEDSDDDDIYVRPVRYCDLTDFI